MHGGTSDPANLAWSCMDCNVHKGTNIASYDRITDALTPLFNPRSQLWPEHFQLQGAEIGGVTPVGRVTVALLDMNNPQQLRTRQIMIELDRQGLLGPEPGSSAQ